MECEQARDLMMEADRAALRGDGEGALARHVRSCGRCAAVGRALAAEFDRVDRRLRAWGDAGDPDAAATAALAAARGLAVEPGGAGARVSGSDPRPKSRPPEGRAAEPRRGWHRLAWLPAAAAAVIATLVLVDRDPVDWHDPAGVGDAPAPRVAVRPPPDRRAAIMETANPDITIIWLYEEEGT